MTAIRTARTPLLCLLLGVTACEQVEQVQDRFRDLTPHEAYQESLAVAGLTTTALGRDWVAAGRTAVDQAAPVSLPFEEQGFITPEAPGAMAYRITVGRGQKLTAQVTLAGADSTRVFVDLFRAPSSESDPPRLASLQRRLLAGTATRVRPGGVLLYSVCSLEPEEGIETLAHFTREHPAFAVEDPRPFIKRGTASSRDIVVTSPAGPVVMTRPDRDGMDGFFAARLRRPA